MAEKDYKSLYQEKCKELKEANETINILRNMNSSAQWEIRDLKEGYRAKLKEAFLDLLST